MKKTSSNQDICEQLLKAETEDAVTSILTKAGFWGDRAVWQPYGNISNNRGVVSNQQSMAEAALVEKLVNSIDAVLIYEGRKRGLLPASPNMPQNMKEAVKVFYGIPNGSVQQLDARSRTHYAEKVQLVATGSKTEPNYLIFDDGEGQNPASFSDTFLSLLKENKSKIPFAQGKFNMGGTGVLQFSGKQSLQLIVSRRQLDLPDANKLWGFTIVRRLEPATDQPYSQYVYLAPNNQVLSFEADYLMLRPGAKYPDLYCESMQAGTCIKLWNYKIGGALKTIATLDLRYALEKFLPDPALPIRIRERRMNYKANTYDTTMSGLMAVISDSPNDIEPGMDTGTPLDIQNVGQIDLKVVLVREGIGEKKYPSGIIFHQNGQLHSDLNSAFVARKCKLDYIADSLIVLADCTNLPQIVKEDVFLGSRDRMRVCVEKNLLENAIVDYIKDHAGLKEINARRRMNRLSSTGEEDAVKVIQDLVKLDPTLANLFGTGEKVKAPKGPLSDPIPFVGKEFPTFFNPIKPKDGETKNCPINRMIKIEFETDAENSYFSRISNPGVIQTHGTPKFHSVHPWNGKATIKLSLPPNCNVGDKYKVDISVSDVSRVQPYTSSFYVVVEPEAEPSESHGGGRRQSGLLGIPLMTDVYQNDWSQYEFDEKSAMKIKYGDGESLDFFVNMDNIHLKNEISRRKNVNADVVRYWFKYGLFFLCMGMLYDQKNQTTTEGDGYDFAAIESASKGMAVTIIPVISQLSVEKKRRE